VFDQLIALQCSKGVASDPGAAATDAVHQRSSLVTSAASQAFECVGHGSASVAAPSDALVVRSGENRPYWTASVGALDVGAFFVGRV
jgi:hypothetical protein